MPAPLFLQLESEVARAHRSVVRAENLARDMSLEGAADDLLSIYVELGRLQEDLLRNPSYKVQRRNLRV